MAGVNDFSSRSAANPTSAPAQLTVLVLSDGDTSGADASARSASAIAENVIILEQSEVDWTDSQTTQKVIKTLSSEWILVLAAGEQLRVSDAQQAKALLENTPGEAIGLQAGLHGEVRIHRTNEQALDAIGSAPSRICRELSIASADQIRGDDTPGITVIVTVTGSPEPLRRYLQNLCVQTTDDFEVIVVADSENTASDVIKDFDSLLDLKLTTTAQGAPTAIQVNAALGLAQGRYVNIQAHTDTMLPQHLEVLRSILDESVAESKPAVLAYGPAFFVAESVEGSEVSREIISRGVKPIEWLMSANFIVKGAAMFDRVAAQSINGMNSDFQTNEDWDLWLRISKLGDIIYVDEATAEWRLRAGSTDLLTQTAEEQAANLQRIYEAHPVQPGSPTAERRAEQMHLLADTSPEDDSWEFTIAVIGDGDLNELTECLKSVSATLPGVSYQLIVHELRTSESEQMLAPLAREATVIFYDVYDEASIIDQIKQRAGTRDLTVLHSSERLSANNSADVDPGATQSSDGTTASSAQSSPGLQSFFLDYPVSTSPRYGYGRPVHSGINALFEQGREGFQAVVAEMVSHAPNLARIPILQSQSPTEPFWNNGFCMGLDAALLYTMIASERPRKYLEIGSGNSTRFARRAIDDHGLATVITSIDPAPRAECDSLCNTVIRSTLEQVPLDIFADIGPGDIVFFDGSHRSVMNSDASVFFLEVVPMLPPGTLVHVHDIFWPQDYPPEWADRIYSEQYLLGALLLAPDSGMDIIIPAAFVALDQQLWGQSTELWNHPALDAAMAGSGAFWFRTR